MAITVAERNSIINAYLAGASHASYAGNTALWMSLHTADPGDTGASEVTGGSYARQSVTFGAAASASAGLAAQTDFTGMPATTTTHVGFWTASTAGTFLGGGALSVSKTTASGDTLRFAATTGVTVSIS